MTATRQALGELGERIAARWLRRGGWRIVAHRFRSGHRDIDLVVERDGTVAFVEVKARRSGGFGGPVEAVGWRKQRELARSAAPLSTAEVAETLGLHANTVRPHLERMREVGLLAVHSDNRGSVGRQPRAVK